MFAMISLTSGMLSLRSMSWALKSVRSEYVECSLIFAKLRSRSLLWYFAWRARPATTAWVTSEAMAM